MQEDIDFSSDYTSVGSEEDVDGTVQSLFLSKVGLCTSGIVDQEIINIPTNTNQYFVKNKTKKLTAQNYTELFLKLPFF